VSLKFEELQYNNPAQEKMGWTLENLCSLIETPRMSIMATSFLNEISTDHLENRVMVRGEALLRTPPSLFYSSLLDSI
jgi:hypothetical protein